MSHHSAEEFQDWTPDEQVLIMAEFLESRHGSYAAEIADFFALAHARNGNRERHLSWSDVALCVREREWARIDETALY